MKKRKSIDSWAREVYANSLNHSILAELSVKITAQYSYMTELYINARLHYAEFYNKYKFDDDGKKQSDPFILNLYLVTEEGQEWYTLKKELRAYELLISSTKNSVYAANTEQRLNNQPTS